MLALRRVDWDDAAADHFAGIAASTPMMEPDFYRAEAAQSGVVAVENDGARVGSVLLRLEHGVGREAVVVAAAEAVAALAGKPMDEASCAKLDDFAKALAAAASSARKRLRESEL